MLSCQGNKKGDTGVDKEKDFANDHGLEWKAVATLLPLLIALVYIKFGCA